MLSRSKLFGSKFRVTFKLPVAEPAGPVSVVGSFNDWTPGSHELIPRRRGPRTVSVVLPHGVHTFRYLGTDGHWFDDHEADRVEEQGSILELVPSPAR